MTVEFLRGHPARRVVAYFVAAIVVGAILLYLPVSAAQGQHTLLDSLFTATSAVCVTGLTVLDTGRDFSPFGQTVILILIQLGGLGIMTFATLLIAGAGARLSLPDRLGLSQTFVAGHGIRAGTLLSAVVTTTIGIELLGAAALFAKFSRLLPAGEAAWAAVFHAVSAFCNAGFSTFSNSLEGFRQDSYTLVIFSILIILGGLGFIVLVELSGLWRGSRRRKAFSLHTKLCLATTAVLLVGGTVAFYLVEQESSLSGLSPFHQWLNAFFQSVTARTAGFDSLAQSSLTELSILVTLILMVIGASPGSTGGGVKTTTAAVVFLVIWNRFRGHSTAAAFHRTISQDSKMRAVTILLLSVLALVVIFAMLMFAEPHQASHRLSHGWFVDNLFETVSAFGTVGLSLGRTPQLGVAGKLLIILTMFGGRVGLLTLAYALVKPLKKGEIVYAEESVMIG